MFDPKITWRIHGTRFDVRASTLVVLAVVIGGALSRDGVAGAGASSGAAWAAAWLLAVAAVLAIVVGREVARVSISRRLSWRPRGIELRLFGGVIDEVDAPASPRVEALAALAAYGALIAAGAAAMGVALVSRQVNAWPRASGTAIAAAVAGLIVVQFMPALHLDAGRVFHALVWHLTDDARVATVVAGLYAQVVALGMIAAGIMLLAGAGGWPFWGLAAAVIGLQISGSARVSARRTAWRAGAASLTLGDLALAPLATAPANTTIDDAFERLIAGPSDAYLLVTDAGGAPAGVLRVGDLRGTKRVHWDQVTVQEVMMPLAGLPRLSSTTPVLDAVHMLDRAKRGAAIERDGRVVAVATRGQVLYALVADQRDRSQRRP